MAEFAPEILLKVGQSLLNDVEMMLKMSDVIFSNEERTRRAVEWLQRRHVERMLSALLKIVEEAQAIKPDSKQ